MNRKLAIVTSLAAAIVFIMAIPLFVKSATLTPNLSMNLIAIGETGWGPMLNTNTSTMDSLFGTSSGHEHTGVAGEGPKINLTTAVTGTLPTANGGTGGTLPVANGGTGATSASSARSNLGVAASGSNSDITSITALTGLTISTASPASDIDLRVSNTSGASSANGVRFLLTADGTNNTGDVFIRYVTKNGGAGENNWVVGADTSDSAAFKINTGSTLGATADGLKITTGGVATFSGSLGVGSLSAPSSKLGVVSATNDGVSVTDGTVRGILYSTSSDRVTLGTTTNHPLVFFTNNTEKVRITEAGNLGIGVTPGANRPLYVAKPVPAANLEVILHNNSTATSANGTSLIMAADGTNNTGDVWTQYINKNGGAGGVTWSSGVDTSDTNAFKINTGSTLGATADGIKIATAGRISFPGGVVNLPNSATIPATCTVGDVYVDTSKGVGQKYYYCDSVDTWKQVGVSKQILYADDLYNGATGAALAIGTADAFQVFGVRYNATTTAYSEGFAYPAGTFSYFSVVMTPGSATCTYTATLEKNTGGGYASCVALSGLTGTARTGTYSASTCTTNAGDKIRVKWADNAGAGCGAATGVAPVSQVVFEAS